MSNWDQKKTYGKVALTTAMSIAAARDGIDTGELQHGYVDYNNLARGQVADDVRRNTQLQAELDRFNGSYRFDK